MSRHRGLMQEMMGRDPFDDDPFFRDPFFRDPFSMMGMGGGMGGGMVSAPPDSLARREGGESALPLLTAGWAGDARGWARRRARRTRQQRQRA
jgi:hypothetical protein